MRRKFSWGQDALIRARDTIVLHAELVTPDLMPDVRANVGDRPGDQGIYLPIAHVPATLGGLAFVLFPKAPNQFAAHGLFSERIRGDALGFCRLLNLPQEVFTECDIGVRTGGPMPKQATLPDDYASGSVNRNVAPWPAAEYTQMRPPWDSTIFLQIAKPTPVPGYASREWRR